MKRTQIYLTEKEKKALDRLSNQMEVSKSSIIREAVDEYLAKHSDERRQERFDQAEGMWKNREDLPDFNELRKEWDRF